MSFGGGLKEQLDFLDLVFADERVRQQWRRPPEEEIRQWCLVDLKWNCATRGQKRMSGDHLDGYMLCRGWSGESTLDHRPPKMRRGAV